MTELRRIELTLDLILVELRTLNTFLSLGEMTIRTPQEVYETSERMVMKSPAEAAQSAPRP
jgi:hypothetical protein